jgi:hypothetical protein
MLVSEPSRRASACRSGRFEGAASVDPRPRASRPHARGARQPVARGLLFLASCRQGVLGDRHADRARVPNNVTDSRAFAGAIRCWRRQSKGTAFLRSICSTLDHAAESRTASSVDRRSRDSRVDENPAMCPTPATAAVATPFERADSEAAVARSRPEGRQSGTQSRRGMLEADQVLWRAVRPLSTGGPWPLRGRTLRWSAGRGL